MSQPSTPIPLLAALPPAERARLLASLTRRDAAPGGLIVGEDEPGDRAYLILAGEVEVIKALGTPEERLLRVAGPDEFVGEMSLLNPGAPRAASLRARTRARLLELTAADFEGVLRQYPVLVLNLARDLSGRLRDSDNATIHDLQLKNRQLTQAYQALQAAQAQLVEKEKLEHELTVARQIQESLLPRELPSPPGYDLGARVLPARFVGGDFYDVFPLGHERLGLVVGDVCGKGVPSALVMAMTRSLLRPAAVHGRTPERVLRTVNAHLLEMNASGLFVTVLYGILTPASGEFVYVRAGHELPIVVDPAGGVSRLARGLGQPLGLLDEPELEAQSLTLPPGGLLLLHSDGAPDTLDPDGAALGVERLRGLAAAHTGQPAQQVCDGVLDTLLAYQRGAPQHDDITLLAVRAR